MAIDLGDSPVGTPPTPEQRAQMRTALGLGTAATQASSAFATAAQGALAATAVQPGALAAVSFSGSYADLTGQPTTWTWASITSRPTTLSGYGITDAATAAQGALAATAVQPGALAAVATSGAYGDLSGRPSTWAWAAITGIPTTSAGYGIAEATAGAAGSMSSADKTKLDGIASGATANASNAELRDRSTHTGTQAAATISDFASAVAATASVTALAARLNPIVLTQAAYDALDPPDEGAIYIVAG